MCSHLCLSFLGPNKLLILGVNGVLCHFPRSTILQGNVRVFGKNVDKTKVEVGARVENFLATTFQKFYIVIWSCLKFEDVLEVYLMLMLENFLDQFIFIWGHEQCYKIFGEISPKFHYYLNDLKCLYYACSGLPYGT